MRYAVGSLLFGTAAVLGGVWLYAKYGPRRHRAALGLSTGMLVGQQVGAATGLLLAGPVGLIPGAMAGGIAGAVVGQELAEPGAPEPEPTPLSPSAA